MGGEVVPHRDHSALAEAMLLVEGARTVLEFVGEQRDTKKILSPRVTERMLEKSASVPLTAMIPMDDEILQQEDEATLRRADGDQEVDHSDDSRTTAQDKDPSTTGLFENETQASHLLFPVGNKVRLVREEVVEQVRQLGQIVEGRRFDQERLRHPFLMSGPAPQPKPKQHLAGS